MNISTTNNEFPDITNSLVATGYLMVERIWRFIANLWFHQHNISESNPAFISSILQPLITQVWNIVMKWLDIRGTWEPPAPQQSKQGPKPPYLLKSVPITFFYPSRLPPATHDLRSRFCSVRQCNVDCLTDYNGRFFPSLHLICM